MSDVHDGPSLRAALAEIAGNFSFSWTPGARQLFAELDRRRFSELLHNPTALLSELTDEDLRHALTPEYAMKLGRVQERLQAEAERPTWWDEQESHPEDFLVAYFSAEFGLDESLPVYSGGLGILAGDHLKSASELGVPLVAVGLNYFRGYFRQPLHEGRTPGEARRGGAPGRALPAHRQRAAPADARPDGADRDARGRGRQPRPRPHQR